MYSVEALADALEQVADLPTDVLPSYAELMTLLEVAPWSGDAYSRHYADASVRDPRPGTAIYLTLEQQRRVVVLRVLWLG